MHHVELTLMISRCDISLFLARMLGLWQNVCCSKSTLSGLLSAVVIFTTQQIPSLKSPKWELAAGVVLCTCMYCSMYRFPACTRKRLHTLPSDPVMGDKTWGIQLNNANQQHTDSFQWMNLKMLFVLKSARLSVRYNPTTVLSSLGKLHCIVKRGAEG